MGLDINTKKAKKNAFRIGKVRGEGASRIRVPGGYLLGSERVGKQKADNRIRGGMF